ncbi:MAG: ATP-binding protein [Sulfuricurvum sp.]|uniref:ATP-binding protein n=1 Tax=Sulfuricurvum sp. TaxID=2025608 RepID=UPI0026157334|nr:ATP-binding protein [Sulfuricurvum sp.]MDD2829583.1 ATP-binding protein [Sulfuricurvum sp.]MDD4950370.1 ATP-binding protein [Sulfuricurvum sp.]
MRKILLSIALVTTAFATQIEVDVTGHPESVLVNGKIAYVSNVGNELKPTEKDGDGYISLINQKGEVVDKNFLTGLNAPKGMALIGGTLYVADVDTVRGYNLKTKKEIFSLVFEGVNFLNDITVQNENTLLISSTDKGKIFEINVKNKSYKAFRALPDANGLLYSNGIIYGVGHKLVTINLKNHKTTELSKKEGIFDGIQKSGDTLYFSDWVRMEKAGVIHTYNLKTKKEHDLPLETIAGPADFWIDSKTNTIWIPKMMEGKLLISSLK